MIRAVAVDDERHVLERLERMLSNHPNLELCGVFESGEACLAYLRENAVDAVFLDIEMPGINGLALSERILDLDDQIDIVFVTAYQEYAVQAFEVRAADYLLKPLTEERLEKAIRRLVGERRRPQKSGKVEVRCFLEFSVLVDGEVMLWNHAKAKELLAFLVHKKGTPVNWEKIADAIWPEFRPDQAQTNFHATNYLLRKSLAQAGIGQIYENARGNYRIKPELISCDFYEFQEIVKKAQMGGGPYDLQRAKVLYQGSYFGEDGYEWAYPIQAELEEQYKRIKIMSKPL